MIVTLNKDTYKNKQHKSRRGIVEPRQHGLRVALPQLRVPRVLATSAAATALYADSLDPKIRALARPVRVLPGDALVTRCRYDTRDRANITLGGFGFSEEMCVDYVHYYPRCLHSVLVPQKVPSEGS